MLTRRSLLFAFVPALGSVAASAAQEGTPEKPSPLFAQLIPEPTGKNGYEEIIRAGDRLSEAKAPYPNSGKSNTLTVKRGYVADPACRAALSLLRQGVRKPITVLTAPDLPFYMASARLRALARLLGFRVHVGFADGDGGTVVADVLGFLRFTDAVKSVNLVSGMIGGGMEQSVLTPLAWLRDSWSERDCARLLAFAKSRAEGPDPALPALAAERTIGIGHADKLRTDLKLLGSQFEFLSSNEDTEGTTKSDILFERFRSDAGVRARVLGEVSDAVGAYYDRAAALLADPTRRLTLETPPAEKSRFHEITLHLRDSLVLEVQFTVRQPVTNRLAIQLLGAHAAILRFRWENDRLPEALEELGLPTNLVTDPFTQEPLVYEPNTSGRNYKLASAGALTPGKDGKPDAREPFTLPREIRRP